MASRSAPNRTKSQKPTTKQKPASLQGISLSPMRTEPLDPLETDYLNDDLLEDEGDDVTPSPPRYQARLGPIGGDPTPAPFRYEDRPRDFENRFAPSPSKYQDDLQDFESERLPPLSNYQDQPRDFERDAAAPPSRYQAPQLRNFESEPTPPPSRTQDRAQDFERDVATPPSRYQAQLRDFESEPTPPGGWPPSTRTQDRAQDFERDPTPPASIYQDRFRRLQSDAPPAASNLPDRARHVESDTSDGNPHRLVIAIDYGTTFTGVAFATPKSHDANLNEIKIIYNWGKNMSNKDKVPSVYSYSPAPNDEQQWGESLSPKAVTMINTKLELDVQDNKTDELELILQVLDGMNNLEFEHVRASGGYPEYTWKNPEEIVADYLTKVFHYLEQRVNEFGQKLRERLPVDIVMTVPVNWSYRAKNSTLRAIMSAGFNKENFLNLQDIIMVTEPEAAAIYTARYLKGVMKQDFLKLKECFVLIDAGGGTVDVVSYSVTKLEPGLELKQIGKPYSWKCGSAYIDTHFKQWLRDVIGEGHFQALDPKSRRNGVSAISEGSEMRHVIKQFDAYKKKFTLNVAPMKIDLPEPLNNITIPGKVNQGELTITVADMQSFFDPCIDRVIELYQGQLQQIEREGRRLKNVFLIGGFGESPFLQSELKDALRHRKVELRVPDTSWTAVVRGAAIHGIEKSHRPNVVYMKTCQRSYGIVLNETFIGFKNRNEDREIDAVTGDVQARGQITWLVKKGDLILSDEGKTSEKEFRVTFPGNAGPGERKKTLVIYGYEDDDLPDRYQNAHEELKKVAEPTYDLSEFPLEDFNRAENPTSRSHYYIAYLTCKMVISGSTVTVEILWNDHQLCSVKIPDVDRKGSIKSWTGNIQREFSVANRPYSGGASSSSIELPGSY